MTWAAQGCAALLGAWLALPITASPLANSRSELGRSAEGAEPQADVLCV